MKSQETKFAGVFAAALALAFVGSLLSGCSMANAQAPTASSPAPSPTSFQDSGKLLAACLTERGWDVEVDSTGGVYPPDGIPVAQADLFNADTADCLHQFGAPRPLSDDEKATYYSQLEDVATCLESKGYPVSDKPSFQEFAESDSGNWDPYSDIPTGSEQETATKVCPQPDPYF